MTTQETKPSKRIDKLTLNNQIVSMRKDVRRARLWLINNLNQRARKLVEKKGDERQKAKNQRKAERLRNEMQTLKHIDIDEVSKFALCSKLSPPEVLSELEKLETDQRAMLRLAYHKLIQIRVQNFRDSNSISVDKLILLIRALGLKYQKKKQKKNLENNSVKQGSKTKPETGQKKAKTIKPCVNHANEEEAEDNEDLPSDSNINTSSTGKGKTREIDNEPNLPLNSNEKGVSEESKGESSVKSEARGDESEQDVPSDSNNASVPPKSKVKSLAEGEVKSTTKKSVKSGASDEKERVTKDVKVTRPETSKKLKVQWPVVKEPAIDKKDGECEIKRLNLEKLDSLIVFNSSNEPVRNSGTVQQPSVPRDSFFLGGVDPSSESEGEPDKPDFPSSSFKKREPRNQNKFHDKRHHVKAVSDVQPQKKAAANKKIDKYANQTPLGKSRTFGGASGKTIDRKPESDASASKLLDESNLHPSWQAKRKQVASVTEFQGKKIRFDDD